MRHCPIPSWENAEKEKTIEAIKRAFRMKIVLVYKRKLIKIIGKFAREVKKGTIFGIRTGNMRLEGSVAHPDNDREYKARTKNKRITTMLVVSAP